MRFEVDAAQDLGLQHMLENGLAVLRGVELGAPRRAKVLRGLLEMISEADRGSAALRAQSLTSALEDRPAFDRFTLFFRYLKDTTEDLSGQLSTARAALEALDQGKELTPDQGATLEMLLSELLEALERERALAPLHTPREFHYH